MIYQTLDEQLFNRLGEIGQDLGFKVYANLPDLNAQYPFMVLGEISIMPRATKGALLGTANATLHFWGTKNQKANVSYMADQMRNHTRDVRLETRFLMSKINASYKRIFEDKSTDTTLWHAVLELKFEIHY